MKVIHIDRYAASKQQGFEGSKIFLDACCGMCIFATVETVTYASAKTFASAIMKIMLRYGTSHTVVLDKDSKFLGCVVNPSTYSISIATSSRGVITTPCWLNKSIAI